MNRKWGTLRRPKRDGAPASFHRADLITSADFTAAARSAAFGHRIELVNGVRFKELSRKHEVAVFED